MIAVTCFTIYGVYKTVPLKGQLLTGHVTYIKQLTLSYATQLCVEMLLSFDIFQIT